MMSSKEGVIYWAAVGAVALSECYQGESLPGGGVWGAVAWGEGPGVGKLENGNGGRGCLRRLGF